jgi:lantibiotic modifying enzyme
MDDPQSRALALAAGRQLLDVGIKANGGTKWAVAPSVKALYPNFSHGSAGVGFFLAKLYRATADVSMYAAALSAARYLQAVANAEDNSFKIFHHEPGGEDLYYLSWCHGPAGTSRLFHQLAQTTSGDKWQALVERGARATIAAGVPEKQSPGYWNNVSQCCGNAGVGEFFITLQQTTPRPEYADMVRRVSANTFARATLDGDGLKWIQAENRVSPQAVVAQTGFMQGAAGIGTYYLHADALAKGRRPAIVWPDSSLPQPCSSKEKTSRDMSDVAGAASRSC